MIQFDLLSYFLEKDLRHCFFVVYIAISIYFYITPVIAFIVIIIEDQQLKLNLILRTRFISVYLLICHVNLLIC